MAQTQTLLRPVPAIRSAAAAGPHPAHRLAPSQWRWPVPALAAWLLAWGAWAALAQGADLPGAALGLALLLGVGLATAWPGLSLGRRAWLALGFPASMLATGWSVGLSPWLWLLPLGVLLLIYPVRAWRDAPLFPTPLDALDGLAERIALAPGARVLDAGCGLGDGLKALAREWPRAQLHGVEWSAPLVHAARWRCPGAAVRRGDLWADDWADFDLVYLFQRPETMPRAWAKACAQMRPGTWMLSLDFAVPGVRSQWRGRCADGRRVWAYRVPGQPGDRPPSRF